MEKSILEANAKRRIHPGTKAAQMATGPPLVSLTELDSPFQLQEHLKALHYSKTRPSSLHEVPIDRESAAQIANPPAGVDRALWLYELCRFLINKCNDLIIGFLFDSPPCSATTCPEMRASEWQFLCAVHEMPKSCCAIDYCCHTLDWAANTVTSSKIFPSRLSLSSGDNEDHHAGVKHLTNIFRRLHRIFAHAWFQHREVFWRIEGETGLYVLFKTVCDTYELLPAENYKLPPEAEGLESPPEVKATPPRILKPEGRSFSATPEDDDSYKFGRNNTRRHVRSSPSTGSAVTTVIEADENDNNMAERMKRLQIKEQDEEKESTLPQYREAVPEDTSDSDAESIVTQLARDDDDDDEDKEQGLTRSDETMVLMNNEGKETSNGSESQVNDVTEGDEKETPVHRLNLDEDFDDEAEKQKK